MIFDGSRETAFDSERLAWEEGDKAGNGWVTTESGITYIHAWGVEKGSDDQWGKIWQRLGPATPAEALKTLAAFLRGRKLNLLSTRFKTPAKEWATNVKRMIEREQGDACMSPNEDNVNFTVIEEDDQGDRDGRWLLVFIWSAKAALFSGGRMIQLLIPGLGLSPMQLAEEQIAKMIGLPIERRVLNRAEADKFGLTIDASLLETGGADDQVTKIEAAVRRLQNSDMNLRQEAATELRERSISAKNKVTIATAGGIKPLVELLEEGTADAKGAAAGALRNLAVNAENEVAIATAGGIEQLVKLLKEGAADAKGAAAGALQNLAVNAENMVAIATAGSLNPLVKLLKEGTQEAKEEAAGALRNLAVNAENKVAIATAGGIEPLVKLLKEGTADAKGAAAGALRNLAVHDDIQVAIVKAGAIEPLVKLHDAGTPEAKDSAAGALKNLSYAPGHKEIIAKAGYRL